MPSAMIHINLFGFKKEHMTKTQKDILWEKSKKAAEKLAEETGLSVSGISVR